jgi:hypothetical protein
MRLRFAADNDDARRVQAQGDRFDHVQDGGPHMAGEFEIDMVLARGGCRVQAESELDGAFLGRAQDDRPELAQCGTLPQPASLV